ncbi:hypothetical protein F5X98DRAFT_356593 [Xylaria grammica]|nr:hypothetical protein F5X98DRAFT_356593 [Xylaria grammica]
MCTRSRHWCYIMRESDENIILPRAQFHNNDNYGGDQVLGLKLSGGVHCWFGTHLIAVAIVAMTVILLVLVLCGSVAHWHQ